MRWDERGVNSSSCRMTKRRVVSQTLGTDEKKHVHVVCEHASREFTNIRNLHHENFNELGIRRYDAFLYDGLLTRYKPEYAASPLRNPKTARVFAHYIHVVRLFVETCAFIGHGSMSYNMPGNTTDPWRQCSLFLDLSTETDLYYRLDQPCPSTKGTPEILQSSSRAQHHRRNKDFGHTSCLLRLSATRAFCMPF